MSIRVAFGIVLLAVLAGAAKKPQKPELQIIETAAHRADGKIAVDGRVRNSGEKPIQGLVLLFNFMAPGKLVITTQKTTIDEVVLEPGDESTFHVEMNDAVRAVKYQLGAVDRGERELRVENTGPFPIE